MTKIYMVVTLIINGASIPGDAVDGWHRMEMPDMAACTRAADRGNKRALPGDGLDDIVMHCETVSE